MNTVNKFKTAIIPLLLLSIVQVSKAQERTKTPRHFVGLYSGADFITTSVFSGVTYEHLFRAGTKTEWGIKGSYTFPYRLGNLQVFARNSGEPRFSNLSILGTGYFFTNAQKKATGFFFNAEAGFSGGARQFTPRFGQSIQPEVGAGFGWKWPLRNGTAIRWGNTLQYSGPSSWLEGKLSARTTLTIGF